MEELNSNGLHFDEFQKLRVLDPEISAVTKDLKEECETFLVNMSEFRKMSDQFITFSDQVSKDVEKEKLAAIGARNRLKSMTKAREQEQQQLQALIVEKKMEFERLRIQFESLQKTEAEQQEFIEQLILHS